MKTLIAIVTAVFIVVAVVSSAFAWTVHVAWTANTEADLAKYTLYDNGVKVADVMPDPDGVIPTEYAIQNVVAGIHRYELTATDKAGNESNKSNPAIQPLMNWVITITGTATTQ